MVGAVQFGVLAACVVLFVPMILAGWHLSRNKMLFFSGALFITLAVGVHLTPYFPSITNLLSSLSSTVVLDNRSSCLSFLHEIIWDVKVEPINKGLDEMPNFNTSDYEKSWSWAKSIPVNACGFQKLGRSDACDLLNGSWIVVAGDSQARLVVVSLLNLVLDPVEMESVSGDLFKRHSDYNTVIDEIGVKLDFIWAPYVTNLTDFLVELKHNRHYPDVLVMGSGLWHMLHVTDSSDYGVSLGSVKQSLLSFIPVSSEYDTVESVSGSFPVRSPHMFWLGMPMLINSMLNTEEKREKMNFVIQDSYDQKLHESKLLRQSGGPMVLLDVKSLSRNCGSRCTMDGMHYDPAVYEAAIHVMLNALLIESQQRL
ncbi:hypothetical protein IFM89_021693 [Coptis chinensis]|uniref:Pmr5/Cas1p GDSL/SGNH-like acyl-esterase family protein n=1 Tax=Coptis chinensis TaxID=261450 RepID=A0A835IXQ9_9MAGN|nr:hypothetical protein IFM89_021693 [Coptis chinensis]